MRGPSTHAVSHTEVSWYDCHVAKRDLQRKWAVYAQATIEMEGNPEAPGYKGWKVVVRATRRRSEGDQIGIAWSECTFGARASGARTCPGALFRSLIDLDNRLEELSSLEEAARRQPRLPGM